MRVNSLLGLTARYASAAAPLHGWASPSFQTPQASPLDTRVHTNWMSSAFVAPSQHLSSSPCDDHVAQSKGGCAPGARIVRSRCFPHIISQLRQWPLPRPMRNRMMMPVWVVYGLCFTLRRKLKRKLATHSPQIARSVQAKGTQRKKRPRPQVDEPVGFRRWLLLVELYFVSGPSMPRQSPTLSIPPRCV